MSDAVPILFSAQSWSGLKAEANRLAKTIEPLLGKMPAREQQVVLGSLASKECLRSPFQYRAAVVASNFAEFHERLLLCQASDDGELSLVRDGVASARIDQEFQKVLFLYPGQGSQQVGENSAVAAIAPFYAKRVRALEREFTPINVASYLSKAWDDESLRRSPEARETSSATSFAQPMVVVTGIAMTDLLGQLGVVPDVSLGHSVGELSAVYASGLASAIGVCNITARRTECMTHAKPEAATGLLAVAEGRDAIEYALGEDSGVHLACDNSSRQTVLGGLTENLLTAKALFDGRAVRSTMLNTQGAFHTPFYRDADLKFRAALLEAEAHFAELPSRRYVSSVSGASVADGGEARELLARQVSTTVRFREALVTVSTEQPTVVIQLHGGNSLIRFYRDTVPEFRGREIAFGGANDTAQQVAVNIGELFLSVKNFAPNTLLGSLGIAALAPRLAEDKSSVLRTPSTKSNRRNEMGTKMSELGTAKSTPDIHEVNLVPVPAHGEYGAASTDSLIALFDKQLNLLSTARFSQTSEGSEPKRHAEPPAPMPAPDRSTLRPRPASIGSDSDYTRNRIVEIVAEFGGYSPADIDENALIAEDLGLDSLLMTNIVSRVAGEFPIWSPQDIDLSTIRTLSDLIFSVAKAKGEDRPLAPVAGPGLFGARSVPDTPSAGPQELDLSEFAELIRTDQQLESASTKSRNPYYLRHDGRIGATTRIDGQEFLSFSSYNYLGLTTHPFVLDETKFAVEKYGTSVSAARILSGNRSIHEDLEHSIAELVGAEDSVVLVGGHSTNTSIIPHLYNDKDVIFHDSLVHDSIQQGIRASGASRHSFPHNRLDLLEEALESRRGNFRRALIITEGVFSMDGDIPNLARLVELKKKHIAQLMVDEAHSVGVLGALGGGICQEQGINPGDVDILMGTLSKSLASCGGYIAGSGRLIRNLRYSLSGLIFSAGLTPANSAAALSAIEVLRAEPERLRRLRDNSEYFLKGAVSRGFDVGSAVGVPVVPLIIGDSQAAISLSNRLFDEGISVNPIVFPAVSEAMSRLRFFITSEHTEDQLDRTLSVVDLLLSNQAGAEATVA